MANGNISPLNNSRRRWAALALARTRLPRVAACLLALFLVDAAVCLKRCCRCLACRSDWCCWWDVCSVTHPQKSLTRHSPTLRQRLPFSRSWHIANIASTETPRWRHQQSAGWCVQRDCASRGGCKGEEGAAAILLGFWVGLERTVVRMRGREWGGCCHHASLFISFLSASARAYTSLASKHTMHVERRCTTARSCYDGCF